MDPHLFEPFKNYFFALQTDICTALERFETTQTFCRDIWKRAQGGGGVSAVLAGGQVFEQAGVNFSHVHGDNLPASSTAHRPQLAGARFEAAGVSLVIHPVNPYVPTTHLNVRYFCAYPKDSGPVWWVGGGYDLTPYYGFESDCRHFHQTAKQACDPFGAELYPRFKQWADEYFYLKHRAEPRGVGGIFFDDFNELGLESSLFFLQNIGSSFIRAYAPIVERRQSMPYSQREQSFQHYRRGRYVEFNLLYDRGTIFGLQSGGRTESILMSLPPAVSWRYNWAPELHTPEALLYERFLVPRNWADGED